MPRSIISIKLKTIGVSNLMEKRKRKSIVLKNTDVVTSDDDVWWWLIHKGLTTTSVFIALFALLIRVIVSIHPYSGEGDSPKYGDFEAQRHWMEITINLPPKNWYRNSTFNDLKYWGLDYPPLTAYQSYVHGVFLNLFHPESVALFTSRGHESYLGKLLMRWTVLSSDVLVFFPAVFYFIIVYYSGRTNGRKSEIAWHIAMILLNPCLILIDHGHFQYNCISLGFTIAAVGAVFSNRELVAGVLFSLALNHKQMSAYFAPAFFCHLLGKCLKRRNPVLEVLKLGLVVIGTFTIVWLPYIHSVDAFLGVLSRLAPFERGIYEDYVANFWCTTSVIIKWKRLFSMPSMKLLSFALTVSTCLPSMVHQIRSPSNQGFLYGLLNSSFSFYLFSFQVHEKSILLPLLPAILLAPEEPFLFKWLVHFAMLSMFPLLCRDKLILPYIALYTLFVLVSRRQDTKKQVFTNSLVKKFLVICSFVLHIIYLVMVPPSKYPFLFEAIIMLLCFSQFILLAIYTNIKQWKLSKDSGFTAKEKKLI